MPKPYATYISNEIFEAGLDPYEGRIYMEYQRLLQEECEDLPTLEQLAIHCRMSVGKASESRRALVERGLLDKSLLSNAPSSGWVYVIRCGPYYKIGKALDPETRLKELQTGNPYPLIFAGWVLAENFAAFERKLHKQFADKRTSGEWFELSNEDLELIREEFRSAAREDSGDER